jgi:hypothetical protein
VLRDFAHRLRGALGPIPVDVAEAAGVLAADEAARSPASEALSPWAVWTLVAALRYLPRQLWVGSLMRRGALPEGGGPVPGFPGWSYMRDGSECTVSNSELGETIEVELHRGSAEFIHPFSLLECADPGRSLAPPEARLLALHPAEDGIVLAFDELEAQGVMTHLPREYVYRLSPAARKLDADVQAFVARWEDPAARVWLAASLGDWPLAAELAPGDARIQRATERCLAERMRRLESRIDDPRFGKYALESLLQVAPAERTRRYLVAGLEGAPDGFLRTAVQMIVADEAADFTPELTELFQRLSPEEHTDLVTATGGYLLGRGRPPALVVPSLLRAARVERIPGIMFGKNPCVFEIALLLLEHAPADALPIVRRALRESPSVRKSMVAVLMTLGGAWVERELLAALGESTDEAYTSPLRIALRSCGGPEALAAVERWDAAHETPDKGPALRNFHGAMIKLALEKLTVQVERVRRALPADFGGSSTPPRA